MQMSRDSCSLSALSVPRVVSACPTWREGEGDGGREREEGGEREGGREMEGERERGEGREWEGGKGREVVKACKRGREGGEGKREGAAIDLQLAGE